MERKNALHWFNEAANLGDASAMTWLGFAYRDGQGVSCDDVQAVKWFTKAVDAGAAHSMVYLGRLHYSINQLVPAKEWLLRAAGAGLADSHVPLAMLLDERGTEVYSPEEAVKWWRLIAQRKFGSVGRAMVALARHYRDGVGVARDPVEAKEWLRKCIQLGGPQSQFCCEAKLLLNEMETDLL